VITKPLYAKGSKNGKSVKRKTKKSTPKNEISNDSNNDSTKLVSNEIQSLSLSPTKKVYQIRVPEENVVPSHVKTKSNNGSLTPYTVKINDQLSNFDEYLKPNSQTRRENYTEGKNSKIGNLQIQVNRFKSKTPMNINGSQS